MKTFFQTILDQYITNDRKVDNSSKLYEVLVKKLPREIRDRLNDDNLLVKGSMGQGNKTLYPWISILDRNIATSTQHGIYVCYLFRSDMEGFYLVLSQGITYFENKYGRDKYKIAELISNYMRNEIDDLTFSKDPIDLKASKGSLGYGYEKTTIIQKYYRSGELDENVLIDDLNKMVDIYAFIVKHFNSNKYEDIVEEILDYERIHNAKSINLDVDEASKVIQENLNEDGNEPYDLNRTLKQVEPKVDTSEKFKRITNPIPKKIDYLKKAKDDAKTGLIGEKLVLDYERNRLLNDARLEDYADKIEWIASKSDYYGYDIKSYDIIDDEVKEIHIEVKSTKSKVDTKFQVSKGEVDASKKNKDTYFVYRLYNINSINVSFYRVRGEIEDNFELDPITFMATYRGPNAQA